MSAHRIFDLVKRVDTERIVRIIDVLEPADGSEGSDYRPEVLYKTEDLVDGHTTFVGDRDIVATPRPPNHRPDVMDRTAKKKKEEGDES